jgi:PAS domain S-box-containing protein
MDGKPKRWIGTSTDVHDEVLALNALREAEDHSQFRTETSPQIPWLAGPDGMIYEHGPQWEKLTGLTADDMPESQMLVLHPEDAPAMIITWSRCLETGEPFDCEHRIKVKTGEYRWMRSQAVARKGADDQILRWYGTTEDIHERKSAVHALLESEERYRSLAESLELLVQERTSELEAAYREQESFSYSVSHDLRAPLRSIVSSARILDEDYGSNLPDEAKLMLDRQAHAALRLAHLIDDLLELSRVGRKELTKTNVDVTELFTIVSTSIEKPETLRFSIEQNLRANGDARLLQLLAQNLVENAVKFSPNGGLVRIGRSPEDGAFFISDQGVGFRQEYSAKLFLPFHRLHTDEEFPGTGIGLASVKRIVERHGGRIWAEGEVGKGATFYFILA